MPNVDAVSAEPVSERPAVSVIVVSDYAAGDTKGWDDIRTALAALAQQDFGEPAEFLFSNPSAFATKLRPLRDATLPFAGLARLGPLSIPVILAGKILASWRDCFRCGRFYGVRWFQLPAAMLISIAVHLMEVPGMWRAYQGGGLRKSSFR
jgi:hypothetical protein